MSCYSIRSNLFYSYQLYTMCTHILNINGKCSRVKSLKQEVKKYNFHSFQYFDKHIFFLNTETDGAASLGGACRLLLRAGALVGAEFPGLSAAELAAFARAGVAPSSLDPPGRQPQGFSASLWAPAPSAATAARAARAALLALRDGLPARARPALWESPGGCMQSYRKRVQRPRLK